MQRKLDSLECGMVCTATEMEMKQLLRRYHTLMAIEKGELTVANVEPFRIDLLDKTPVAQKPMRYNPEMRKFIDQEVDRLLK